MARLSETEIFSKMTESLRLAEEASRELAVHPGAGETYNKLRFNLRLVEGCCRQASAWRDDTRWLPIGLVMGKAHKLAGDWLRGVQMPNGRRRPLAAGERHPAFLGLAANLLSCLQNIEKLRTGKTGVRGAILPAMQPAPHRDHRPVQVRMPGGILLPTGMAA